MPSPQRDTAPRPKPPKHAAVAAHPVPIERLMAEALRSFAIAEPEHSLRNGGASMPLAEAATVLWTRFLKFDAADPHWPDRDSFVFSAAENAALLGSLLHASGYDGIDLDALASRLPFAAGGQSEPTLHPAIGPSMGPPEQALAVAVGMALAERLLAGRFGQSLVDHRTWLLAANGDLLAGISHEAASLAGHLRLHKLAVLYDDTGSAADGASAVHSDDVLKRFAAYGWAVRGVDRHDMAQIEPALSYAMRSRKPTLIALRARDGAASAGAPEVPGRDRDGAFADLVAGRWRAAGARGAAVRRGWLKRAVRHPLRAEFERVMAGRLPESWHPVLAGVRSALSALESPPSPQRSGQEMLAELMGAIPELITGSAEPDGSRLGLPPGMASIGPGNYRARHVCYGIREHGMAATMNGMALHGGVIPCAATLLGFSDALRPALRLAASARNRVIHLLAYEPAGPEQAGAVHLPAGHLASLRAVPNLHVYRPADAMETAECWELALRRDDGPSLMVLTSQPVPSLRTDTAVNRCARGGYMLADAEGARQATLIASGAEVSVALAAREALAREAVSVAVVSLPCWELFEQQEAAYRASVLGNAPRLGIEAALGFGWERWLGDDGWFTGLGGPDAAAAREDGQGPINPQAIVGAVKRRLAG